MEPRIQYAKTKDGVSIAFLALAEGTPPLATTPAVPMSHLRLEWDVIEYRAWPPTLTAQRR